MLPQTCCPVNKKIKKIFNTIALESSLITIPLKHRSAGRVMYTHLLETASWKDWVATARCGRKINVSRGQLFTSTRKLEGRIGIKKYFVIKILEVLEKMQLIRQCPCPEGTLITLPFYDLHMAREKSGLGRKLLDITEINARILQLPEINRATGSLLFRHLINVVHFTYGNSNHHTLRPGETLTSRAKICNETGLSPRQTQTALTALVKFGLIKTFSTWAGTRVRVIGYDRLHIQDNLQGGVQPVVDTVSHYKNRISEEKYHDILHGRVQPLIGFYFTLSFKERNHKKPSTTANNYMQNSGRGFFNSNSEKKEKTNEYHATIPILKAHVNDSNHCLKKLQEINSKYRDEPVKWLAYLIQAKKGRDRVALAYHLLSNATYPPRKGVTEMAQDALFRSNTPVSFEETIMAQPILKDHLDDPLTCLRELQKIYPRYKQNQRLWLAFMIFGKSKNKHVDFTWNMLSDPGYLPPNWADCEARKILENEREHANATTAEQ